MVKVPKQFQNPEYRFVLLGQSNMWARKENGKIVERKTFNCVEYDKLDKKVWSPLGKAPYQAGWQNKEIKYNNPELLKHEKNFGIIGGKGGLIILDIDDKSLGVVLENKADTLTTKTGSGGKHLFFESDYKKNHVLINELGELRSDNYQVVCSPSQHPNGEPYVICKDKPIRKISEEDLLELIKPYMRKENEPTSPTTEYSGGDTSRSATEYREIIRQIGKGKTKEELFKHMEAFSKWSSSHNAYKEKTYNKAKKYLEEHPKSYQNTNNVENSPEAFDDDNWEVFSDEELMSYEPPKQEWLIKGQIPKGEFGVLAGKRGERKSFIGMCQVLGIASGKEVFEDEVHEKKKVLWLDEEMGKGEIAKRSKLLKNGMGISEEKLEIKYLSRTGLKLDRPDKKFEKFRELVLEFKPDLIVGDCLQRLVTFEVDKDNAKISDMFTSILRPMLKTIGSAFLFIHHLRKSQAGGFREDDPLDAIRGGSELVNFCRFVLMVQTPKYQQKTNEGGEMVLFRVLKMSNAEIPEPKVISFTSDEESIVVKYEGLPEEVLAGEVQCAKAIKEYLFTEQITGEFKTKDILEASEKIGFKKTLISSGLKVLLKEGFLDKAKRGVWEVSGKENKEKIIGMELKEIKKDEEKQKEKDWDKNITKPEVKVKPKKKIKPSKDIAEVWSKKK
jgi:RecA-family ATPase